MIPTNWNEITIGQYQSCYAIMQKKLKDLEQRIALAETFMGAKADCLTVADLLKETNKLDFMNEYPSAKMAYGFELDGKKFSINVLSQTLTAGQFIDLSELTKDKEKVVENLHKIMAVIATTGTYEGYQKNAMLLQSKLPMSKVYPASAFFLKVGEGLLHATQAYLTKELKALTKEMKKSDQSESPRPTSSTGGGLSPLIGSEGSYG